MQVILILFSLDNDLSDAMHDILDEDGLDLELNKVSLYFIASIATHLHVLCRIACDLKTQSIFIYFIQTFSYSNFQPCAA